MITVPPAVTPWAGEGVHNRETIIPPPGITGINVMNRTEQRMKYAEKAGNNNAGRVNVARRYHPSRLSAVSGLALFLSAGLSGSASALTFTFDYTYTIEANTCTLSAQGTDNDGAIPTSGTTTLNVNWGTVTKEQLKDPDKASKKTFGLVMDCQGDIYKPTLTVTGKNGSNPSGNNTLYVADSQNSVAGFAVKASDASDATETEKTQNALTGQGQQTLSETGHKKKMLLEAWPVILPGKNEKDLKSGTEINGTVTIKVSYN
ncbi:type 1 fimbrial protein [Salmonella enterica]|nr:type 1 fimbrial protein [Salmonella enterica]